MHYRSSKNESMDGGTDVEKTSEKGYLSIVGAWALAFGCSVGWGAFVMPGSTFLPIAGPVGTSIGLALGAVAMLIIALNYNYLMNTYPDGGGVYTYTKKCFGYDHGFISAWFLILTYIAVLWANATALPLIARTILGDFFQFGFNYEIAGFHVYMGELLLITISLVVAAVLCLYRKLAEIMQIIFAITLIIVASIIFFIAMGRHIRSGADIAPSFSSVHTKPGGVLTIFALAPWAYVGFESISHSAGEAAFSLKKCFRIMLIALFTAAIAYIFLVLLAVTALPEGESSWFSYVMNIDKYSGVESQPAFFAAFSVMGIKGAYLLGVAAFSAIYTGIIGNFIALSRLLQALSKDGMLPERISRLNKRHAPANAILMILLISVFLPFAGRTAVGWIVDVTTVGATIAYTFASAAALNVAKKENRKSMKFISVTGIIISVFFALEFLIPNFLSVKTLSTESYLILAAWSILGFIYFRIILKQDTKRQFGRSIVAWVVLLGLIIFTSSVWMKQTVDASIERTMGMSGDMENIKLTLSVSIVIQLFLIIGALYILFDINSHMQRRERQIEVEKALAEDASRAKTSFLSNMSHEIRTPMNAITGHVNIALRDPDLKPETRRQFEKIKASSDHLLGLINDILDMSRIESGKVAIRKEDFSLEDLIYQIGTMIKGQCEEKGLKYYEEVGDDVPGYFFGDDMKLKQILINMLGNSVKYTKPGGEVRLFVRLIEKAEEYSTLEFKISDTGIGMDKEFIPKVFEAFSMEEHSGELTKGTSAGRSYGSTGLGMAITQNYVQLMGGKIDVSSEKGVGTEFRVTVNLDNSDKVININHKEADEKADRDEKLLAGKRILLAEDVEQNAEIMIDLLEMEDIKVDHAADGSIAVKMFSESEPGYYFAILMDVRMPVMDGITACKTIRLLDRDDAGSIPIIAMTANVFEEDMENTRKAGMNAHLTKPVEPEKLYKTLAEYC